MPNRIAAPAVPDGQGKRRHRLVLHLVLAGLLAGVPRLLAATDGSTHGPLTDQPGNAANGRRIVLERTLSACLLCHSGPFPAPHLQGSIGPSLAGVGLRLSPDEIRLRLVDPARFNPDTVMPAYHLTTGLTRVGQPWQGKPVLTAEQIEDVVAFLTTLRDP